LCFVECIWSCYGADTCYTSNELIVVVIDGDFLSWGNKFVFAGGDKYFYDIFFATHDTEYRCAWSHLLSDVDENISNCALDGASD